MIKVLDRDGVLVAGPDDKRIRDTLDNFPAQYLDPADPGRFRSGLWTLALYVLFDFCGHEGTERGPTFPLGVLERCRFCGMRVERVE